MLVPLRYTLGCTHLSSPEGAAGGVHVPIFQLRRRTLRNAIRNWGKVAARCTGTGTAEITGRCAVDRFLHHFLHLSTTFGTSEPNYLGQIGAMQACKAGILRL